MSATIGGIEGVEGVAQSPGEIAGPAVRFGVMIQNDTAAALSLDTVVVTVDYGEERIPAAEFAEPGGRPLVGEVAPGTAADGVYVFAVPTDQRALVRITVDYSVDTPPLVFEGSVP